MSVSLPRSHVSVEPAPFEPAWGLFSRLAVRHGCEDISSFVTLVGGPGGALQFDAADIIPLAAALNGQDKNDLARCSITKNSHNQFMLLGQIIGQTINKTVLYGRVCLSCLEEDKLLRAGPIDCRPHRRAWWDLRSIACCHQHRTPLVATCAACSENLGRYVHPGICGHCGARQSCSTAPIPAIDLLGQAYLLGRLGVSTQRHHAVLDAVDFGTAAHAMVWVGVAALWPSEQKALKHLGAHDRSRALTTGMRVIGAGPEAFRAVLDTMAASVPFHLRSPQNVYGKLPLRLDGIHDNLKWLLEEIQTHSSRHIMHKERTRLLGVKSESGLWTTGGQIARQCGCSVERLQTVGRLTGILEPAAVIDRGTPIQIETGNRLVSFLANTLDIHGAYQALGVTRQFLQDMVAAGLLARAFPIEGTSIPACYLKSDLSQLEHLVAGSSRHQRLPDGMVTIAAAVRICYRSSIEIIEAILSGTLSTHGRLAEAHGILSTLVDTEEVVRVLSRSEDPHLMTALSARRLLGIGTSTMKVLKEKGLLSHYKGGNGVRVVKAFDIRQVQAILKSHVGAKHLAASVVPKTHPKVVHRLLREAGIRPSVDAKEPLWDRVVAEQVIRVWDAQGRGSTEMPPHAEDPKRMTALEACHALGVTEETLNVLEHMGMLSRPHGRDNSCAMSEYDARQVQGVLQKYVSIKHLAKSVTPKADPQAVYHLLEEAGVRPSVDAAHPLFERATAEEIVKAWDDGQEKSFKGFSRKEHPDLMTSLEVGHVLGVMQSSIKVLKSMGLLTDYEGEGGTFISNGFDAKQVEALREAYVNTQTLAYSVSPRTHGKLVRRLLREAGLAPSINAPDPLWERSAAEEIMKNWDTERQMAMKSPSTEKDPNFMTWREVERFLCVSNRTISVLKDKGMLTSYKGGDGSRIVKGFDARQVRAILDTHVAAKHLSTSVVPKTSAAMVIRVLKEANIQPTVDAPQPLWDRKVAQDVVEAWDARRRETVKVLPKRDTNRLSITDACFALGVGPGMLDQLEADGLLARHEDGNTHTFYADDIRSFLDIYASAKHLSASILPRIDVRVIRRILREMDIPPAIDGPEPFWEREIAEGVVIAWDVMKKRDSQVRIIERDPNFMSWREVSQILGITSITMAVLKAQGVLTSYTGSNGVRIVRGYDARQVRAVLERYVCTQHLADSVVPPTHAKVVSRLLREADIYPVFDTHGFLWERAPAEAIIRAMNARRRPPPSGGGEIEQEG